MTQAVCFKNKFGYCRYADSCRYKHVTMVCEDGQCEIQNCDKRHPKICKYFRDYRRCKFTVGCKYKHENNQEKINNLEKQMDKQKEKLEEKNAYILQLELRLGEIEKKFKEEQIRTDKRIRDLENANKSKNNEKNEDTSFKCKDCEFYTTSKRGLRVHIKKKHTNLKSDVFPIECDFCDDKLESEKEMKAHLKNHMCKEAVFKCEDCNFFGENWSTMDVHHGKNHSKDFECGLCDYKAKTLQRLETHLNTCESYICDAENCSFSGKTLKSMENHIRKVHGNDNTEVLHAKLDRKDEDHIIETKYLSHDLFE